MTDHSNQKRMLALDGGGLLGLITLGMLKQIEDDLRTAHGNPDLVLRDFFDYIGGTSTGAIIAAGLMIGRPVQNLIDIYVNHGEDMFSKASWWNKIRSGLSHKYDHTFLANMLQEEFTKHSIAELQAQGVLPTDKHLLIVTRNYRTDSAWPLSTNRDALYNQGPNSNLNMPLWQVIRASTAAPSFFQPEWLDVPGLGEIPFVDGGLTPHNNPALKIYQMATRSEYNCNWDAGVDKMMLCSVGTSFADRTVREPGRMGQMIASLAMTTPSDLMHGINTGIDAACRTIGKCTHGLPIDGELGDMAGAGSVEPAFTYARYNVDVGPKAMAEMKKQGVRHSRPRRKAGHGQRCPDGHLQSDRRMGGQGIR